MDLQLQNKTALVTGSTAGIGLAIATGLVSEGADVVIAGRSKTKLDEAQEYIKSKTGKRAAQAVLADASTSEGAAELLRAVPEIDILINNLGIYEARSFMDLRDEDWMRLFEINVMSGVRITRQYFQAMLRKNWGRVIFISSESGVMPPAEMLQYGVTKSAQLSISRGLAQLTNGTGVTVNAVLPGPTRSEGIVDFLRSIASDPAAPASELEAEFFQKHRSTSLLQRMIEAEEVASMVSYLSSPLSAATNGAALRVEGGLVPTIL